MIPRNLPAGTTLRALVTELIPADHAANVAKEAGDAKVCIRIHGQGRRAKSVTVTTWGATTGQILAVDGGLSIVT